LPIASVGLRHGATDSWTASTVAERVDLRGARVLVVDDQADALSMLQRILDGATATVMAASCAKDALELLLTERFDVIVSDIAMPGMDGYDFLAEARRRGIDTPAIALTAFALPGDVRKATSAGYRAHISKPIDSASLLAIVARFVDREAR
jgi:CheY-like chemotaxis protein